MKVYKFGGASVRDAESVMNLSNIVKKEDAELIVVVSAMDKMTNAFEKMLKVYFYDNRDFQPYLDEIELFHITLSRALFTTKNHAVFSELEKGITDIRKKLIELKRSRAAYDFMYDQIVSKGEWLSTKIVSAYLNEIGIVNEWTDAEKLIITGDKYRNAPVLWDLCEEPIVNKWKERTADILVTQGFVGSNSDGYSTTLGREGSDFSAAIFANILNADSVTIWKDVPGILNADPKFFNNPEKLTQISYHEAVELAYYGATIIHPKTIKPLENKNIPLYVNSFKNPDDRGSTIDQNISKDALIPSYIFMTNQLLISISPRDYSFIMEDNLSHIFGVFASFGVRINLMQNSAISFSVCVGDENTKIEELINELKISYKVLYNDDLELLTIRHYDQKTIDFLTENKEVLVMQKSRHTARIVMRNSQLS